MKIPKMPIEIKVSKPKMSLGMVFVGCVSGFVCFALLAILIVGLSHSSETRGTEGTETNWEEVSKGVYYFHDSERMVGVWVYEGRGVAVLPDSEYKR